MLTHPLLTRLSAIVYLLSFSTVLAQGGSEFDEDSEAPELSSLHGTMTFVESDVYPPVFESVGPTMEIWAKGDSMRTEAWMGDTKLIAIQRGPVIYAFDEDSGMGGVETVWGGLAAMGLIEQIHEVLARGVRDETADFDGILHDVYTYDVNAPAESYVVFLARETSVPRLWMSTLITGPDSIRSVLVEYQNMEYNIEIADEMFEVPTDIEFTELTRTTELSVDGVEERSAEIDEEVGSGPPMEQLESPQNVRQAYLTLFSDTVRYVFGNEPLSAANLQGAMLWRAGLANLTGTCYLDGQRSCVLIGRTDRELVLEALMQALPTADAAGWNLEDGIDREAVVAATVDILALTLREKIDVVYTLAEEGLQQNLGRQPPPELIYSMIGAMARYQREEILRMRPLDGASENIGYLVVSTPPIGDFGYASALFVAGSLGWEIEGPVPESLSAVTADEISAYLGEDLHRERLADMLVPDDRTGGASLFLQEETERAPQFATGGEIEEAVAIFRRVQGRSDSPDFVEWMEGNIINR